MEQRKQKRKEKGAAFKEEQQQKIEILRNISNEECEKDNKTNQNSELHSN